MYLFGHRSITAIADELRLSVGPVHTLTMIPSLAAVALDLRQNHRFHICRLWAQKVGPTKKCTCNHTQVSMESCVQGYASPHTMHRSSRSSVETGDDIWYYLHYMLWLPWDKMCNIISNITYLICRVGRHQFLFLFLLHPSSCRGNLNHPLW